MRACVHIDRTRRWCSVILACAVLLVFSAGPARSERAENGLRIHPSIRLRAVVDDNVFLDSDETSDLALWIGPRLQIDYARDSLRLGLDTGADIRRYRDETSLNEEYGRVLGFAELDLWRGLSLRVADTWVPYPERLGLPEDDSRNLVQSNRAEAKLLYRRVLPRESSIQLSVGATRFTTRGFPALVDTNGDGVVESVPNFHADFVETGGDLEVQRGLGRRAVLFARGELRRRTFNDLPTSDFNEFAALLGLRVRWPARLELDVSAGYGRIDFDELDNTNRFLGTARLQWALPRGLTWTAMAANRFTTDATGRDFVETTMHTGVRKQLGRRMSAELDFAWSRYDDDSINAGENEFKTVSVSVFRQLTRHLKVGLSYRYWKNDGRDRSDDFRQNRGFLEFTYAR
jgi:hypothetical protein